MKRTLLIAAAVAALVFGVVAYANAASDSGTTTVTATVQPKIVLTVPGTVDLGDIYPEVDASKGATLTVKSNKNWTLAASASPASGVTKLETTGAGTYDKGNNVSVPVTITGQVDYTVNPGAYTLGTITYTATQIN